MPGIAGIISHNPERHLLQEQLAGMLRLMRHHRDAEQGAFATPEQGAYLGWVSNSGKTGATAGLDGDVTVLSHGEHFSHDADAPCAGNTPHAILAAYQADGDAFARELNGWFSGVIVDRTRRAVHLFNDRYGMQRIYYWRDPERFVFASEAKAVLSVVPSLRSLDADAVGQYLAYGTVFGTRTLFAGLTLLPAASCWSIGEPARIVMRRYFHPREWEEQEPLADRAFDSALRSTFGRILPAYFRAAKPVGLSLTGGLDTRIVIAGMPKDDEPRPCYTYGGIYRDCFDVQVARRVSDACGLSHEVLPLGQDFFKGFPDYAERSVWVTDGCLDLTGAHEIYYSALARELSPVRLTGNYGSEVMRDVSTFKYSPVASAVLEPGVSGVLEAAQQEHASLRSHHPVTFAAFCNVPWHLAGRRLAAEAVLTLRAPYMDNELVQLLYRAPARARETTRASVGVIAHLNPSLTAIATDMGHGGHANAAVRAIDRLYRYMLFKAEWYYNMGMPDALVRLEQQLPLRRLEPLFLGKHKIEHYRLWCRDRLKGAFLDMLTGARASSRPYLTRAGLRGLVADFNGGRRNCVPDVCRLASLELVQRLFIDGDRP